MIRDLISYAKTRSSDEIDSIISELNLAKENRANEARRAAVPPQRR